MTTVLDNVTVVIRASRPVGWIFGPILFGIGFLQAGYIIPKTTPRTLVIFSQILSLSFPLCIIVFGINDIYDYQTDLNNPRKLKAGLEGGVLSPDYHNSVRTAAYYSTALILLVSLFTRKYSNILATSLLLCVGWQYSALPLRLKEVPFADSLSNGLIIFSACQGFVLALCSSGIHALGAAVDYHWDLNAGQTTIATYAGQTTACFFSFLIFALGWYLERAGNRIFRFYMQIGSLITASSCLRVQWVHYWFQIIVWWTALMVFFWFSSKILMNLKIPLNLKGTSD